MKQKVQPRVEENQTCHVCSKCNGNGFYCMGVLNGEPYSYTGFICHPCKGIGWVVKKKSIKKLTCPRCGLRFPKDLIDDHSFYSSKQNEGKFVSLYNCKK